MTHEKALSALADPTRRTVFERLRSGPKSAGHLAQGLAVSRPAVSQHLKALREAGLVADEKRGRSRIYRIEHGGLEALRSYLDSFWGDVLDAYKEALEHDERDQNSD
ncbi:metalloregulator ArsR/SmtB family transcription factor [Maricaulis sp.]|uniref:ArsR/SmtB family transcription factor n=1 Tax=Maricaulis sp. TaxID=1486257 RepID=UPI00262AB6B3|nr:metalloregulator ArsR/SmtB family transcription factor [Maricaulis sp.]